MISKRQYVFLSFFLTRSLFFGSMTSILISMGKNNALLASILGIGLGNCLLYWIYKKKYINKLLINIDIVFFISISILSTTMLTGDFLLYKTPNLVIIVLFLIPLLMVRKKKIEVTGRISEIIFPVATVIILMAIITLPYLAKMNNLKPFFNSSFYSFFKCILVFSSISIIPNVILLDYKKDYNFKIVSLGYNMGCLVILSVMFFILTIYGYEFASIVRFPEYLILKKIDVFNYVSNVENIFVLEWICSLMISCLFCSKVLYDKISKKWYFLLIGGLFLGLYMVINNSFYIIVYIKKYFYYGAIILLGLFLI